MSGRLCNTDLYPQVDILYKWVFWKIIGKSLCKCLANTWMYYLLVIFQLSETGMPYACNTSYGLSSFVAVTGWSCFAYPWDLLMGIWHKFALGKCCWTQKTRGYPSGENHRLWQHNCPSLALVCLFIDQCSSYRRCSHWRKEWEPWVG